MATDIKLLTLDEALHRVAFLEQQLTGAVKLLHGKDATEAACNARLQRVYDQAERELEARLAVTKARLQNLVDETREAAQRYAFMRQHQVQVWKLGIAASGESLDREIDKAILNATMPNL